MNTTKKNQDIILRFDMFDEALKNMGVNVVGMDDLRHDIMSVIVDNEEMKKKIKGDFSKAIELAYTKVENDAEPKNGKGKKGKNKNV